LTDRKQPGNPLQFGDAPGTRRTGDTTHCGQCEAMLADAVDGTLSAADQALFDAHIAQCIPCSDLLADARRGAAFLDILRDPAPEPPPALLERILILTSGPHAGGSQIAGPLTHLPAAAFAPIPAPSFGVAAYAPAYNPALPFRSRAAFSLSSLRQIALQPRLAMTAAMAFLSIALTLDLTGVRLQDLRVSDLAPSSLKRDFYTANAKAVQYYEGLRVVYELESRVRDLEDSDAGDSEASPSDTNTAQPPAQQPEPANAQPAQPATQSPAPRPSASPSAQPKHRSPTSKAAPGTSRREDPNRHAIPLANRNANSEGGLA
jgi:hypothetical protein